MAFINDIIEALNNIDAWLYDFYQSHFDEIWPMNWLAFACYKLSAIFNKIAWAFHDLGQWIYSAVDQLNLILSWDDIQKLLSLWIEYATTAVQWVLQATTNVTSIITEWWSARLGEVKGLIAIATEGLDTLRANWDSFWTITFPQWTSELDVLSSTVDNFFAETLPTLFDINYAETWWAGKVIDVNKLIETAIKTWFPFYESLADLWDSVEKFFADPLQWIRDNIETFLIRFW